MREWRNRSTTLELGTTWRSVDSYTLLPLYPRGKRPQYQSGFYGGEKNLAPDRN
jgi:hypothetical protein